MVVSFFCRTFVADKENNTKTTNTMKLFRTKKSLICETASRYYRNLWENATKVEFERMNAYDYIRMAGYINGIHYQVHVNNKEIAGRLYGEIGRTKTDNDIKIIKVFAVACACADFGEFYAKFATLENEIILNA